MSSHPVANNHILYTYIDRPVVIPAPAKMTFNPQFNDPVEFKARLKTLRWDKTEDAWHIAKRSKDIDTIVAIAQHDPMGYKIAAQQVVFTLFQTGEQRDHFLKLIGY